jgi:hypothetical protein
MAVKSVSEIKLTTKIDEGVDANQKNNSNFKFRVVDGKQYVVHTVLINDTLSMLSLKYNVSQVLIRTTNKLLTDNVFSRRELLIPVQPGMVVRIEAPEADDSLIRREEQRRESAVKMLVEHIT